jgi:hypothetical protein
MPTIWISNETMVAIRTAARIASEMENTTPADGGFSIDIGADTFERLQEHRRPGENIDAVIARALAAGATKN